MITILHRGTLFWNGFLSCKCAHLPALTPVCGPLCRNIFQLLPQTVSWPFRFLCQPQCFSTCILSVVLLAVFETNAMKECARCLLIWRLRRRSWLTQGSSCWKDTKQTLSVLFSNTQGDNRNTASSKTCLSAKAASDLAYITFLAGCGAFWEREACGGCGILGFDCYQW